MTTVPLPSSTLCFASDPGPFGWDQADQHCYDSFRSSLCTVAQWRKAVCRAGLSSPGRTWTETPSGVAAFATVAGCTGEGVSIGFVQSQLAAACCLEWMNY